MQGDDGLAAVQASLFGYHVQPGNAKIHAALAHADNDVARTLEQHCHAGQRRNRCRILARIRPKHFQPTRCQKINCPVLHNAFAGQPQSNISSFHFLSVEIGD